MSTHRPAKMVGWYDPVQLSRTGVEVLITTILGKYADQRLIQALTARAGVIYDFTKAQPEIISLGDPLNPGKVEAPVILNGEFVTAGNSEPHPDQPLWLDFVADTGDGWDSTYAVASAITMTHKLTYRRPGNNQDVVEETSPGELLIFGGDEVYPTASRLVYEQRLVQPFRAAFVKKAHYPMVFALPGNHDWYDNLVSFSRIFASREPFAGPPAADGEAPIGCRTPQRRSYFALKLPGRWWLLGTDVQLGSDIDGPQFDFFTEVCKRIERQDRVILCTPEPHWVYAEALKTDAAKAAKSALDSLEQLLQRKTHVAVFLAGDVHNYCRYESVSGAPEHKVHKITSGGGGAFLHPTHGPLNVAKLESPPKFQQVKTFPSWRQSWWIGCRNLLFPLWNPWFGLATAAAYVVILWSVMPALEEFPSEVDAAWTGPGDEAPGLEQKNYFAALWYLLMDDQLQSRHLHLRIYYSLLWAAIVLAFALFTDLRKKTSRLIAGFLHGTAHFFVAIALSWLAAVLFTSGSDNVGDMTGEAMDYTTYWTFWPFWIGTIFVFVAGWLAGSLVMGLYLFVMLNVFSRHWNEAFSSLASPDWKNFLRLKIESNGTLTIYAIGIAKVPRTRAERDRNPRAVAGPPITIDAQLIEPPIVIKAPAGHAVATPAAAPAVRAS
jgi:hypothetical protein